MTCQDSGCVFRSALEERQGTNGGCRCIPLVATPQDRVELRESIRAVVDRADGLARSMAALEERNRALAECLAEYVREDDTNEGGKWEAANAPWLRLKRKSQALLGIDD